MVQVRGVLAIARVRSGIRSSAAWKQLEISAREQHRQGGETDRRVAALKQVGGVAMGGWILERRGECRELFNTATALWLLRNARVCTVVSDLSDLHSQHSLYPNFWTQSKLRASWVLTMIGIYGKHVSRAVLEVHGIWSVSKYLAISGTKNN